MTKEAHIQICCSNVWLIGASLCGFQWYCLLGCGCWPLSQWLGCWETPLGNYNSIHKTSSPKFKDDWGLKSHVTTCTSTQLTCAVHDPWVSLHNCANVWWLYYATIRTLPLRLSYGVAYTSKTRVWMCRSLAKLHLTPYMWLDVRKKKKDYFTH